MIKKLKTIFTSNKCIIVNILGAFLTKGFSLVLSLLTMPAYIRFFHDQTILGIWYTIISVMNWVMFFDLGLGNGLRNLLPEAIENNNHRRIKESISTTYIAMALVVVLLLIVGAICIPCINWNIVLNVSSNVVDNAVLERCVLIVYCGILIQFVLKLVTSVLYALQQSALVNFITLFSSILILVALYIVPSGTLEENLTRMAVVNTVAMALPYILISFVVYGKMLPKSFPSIKYFNKSFLSFIMKVGLSLLWLQFVFMIISSTNEFLISYFTSPEYVVDYQAYYKVFKTGAMIFSLALSPIWSAVTKAQVSKNYIWIIKIYKLFLAASVICLVIEMLIIPFLQPLMDVWLGEQMIIVNTGYAVIFVLSSTLFVLHNVNTAIGNGISYFKTQMIWMTFAAVINVPLSYLMVQVTGSWIGVVIANTIALIPYEIIAPVTTLNILKRY